MNKQLLLKLTTELNEFIYKMIVKGGKKEIITVCAAKAIADSIDLSMVKVSNYGEHYTLSYRAEVERSIYDLNELVVVDVKTMNRLVYDFYLYRARIAFDPPLCAMFKPENAIEEFMGVTGIINAKDLCVINENVGDTCYYYNMFRKFFNHISQMRLQS